MKFKLRASFETGSAAGCPVEEGICLVDTQSQVDELCQPPHNFKFLGMADETAEESNYEVEQESSTETEPDLEQLISEAEQSSGDDSNISDLQEVERSKAENEALKRRGGKKGGR